MVWRAREADPRSDRAAPNAIAAYQAAMQAGLPTARVIKPVLKRGGERIPIILLPMRGSRPSR
jgi:hypothetical protein